MCATICIVAYFFFFLLLFSLSSFWYWYLTVCQVLNCSPLLGGLLFGSCIVFMSFVVLNLFVSVILVAFNQEHIYHKVIISITSHYLKKLIMMFRTFIVSVFQKYAGVFHEAHEIFIVVWTIEIFTHILHSLQCTLKSCRKRPRFCVH